MKKIFPFLIALLLIVSCSNDDDTDDNSGNSIFGVWSVTENYSYNCNGQDFEENFSYQISIDEWQTDSILVTNFNERNSTFYGFYSGSSLSISTASGECRTTGIVNNNTINFNSSCTHKSFTSSNLIDNGCTSQDWSNENYTVEFTAVKQ